MRFLPFLRTVLRTPALVASSLMAACLLAFYIPSLARGVTFNDGPEITTAIVTLGVIHPTGYPLFTMLAHLFVSLVPLSLEPCFEVALFNAFAATCAALFVAATVRRLCPHLLPTDDPGRLRARTLAAAWGGALGGLCLGLTPLLWEQVRIPEVYPFHVLLVSWALYQWARFEVQGHRGRDIVWTAIPMGLGLAHHVTIVYMLPAAALFVLLARPSFFVAWFTVPLRSLWRKLRRKEAIPSREPSWYFLVACVLGALPLLAYGYLYWANSHTTGLPWGGVNSWDTLYSHVSGKPYRGYMKGLSYEGIPDRAKLLPTTFYEVLFVAGALLAPLGASVIVRRGWRFLVFLLVFASAVSVHGLQYAVGDYRNYFLPAFVVASLLFGTGAAFAFYRLDREGRGLSRWWHVAWSLSLALIAVLTVFDMGLAPGQLQSLFIVVPQLALASVLGIVGLAAVVWAVLRKRRDPTARFRGVAYALCAVIAVLNMGLGVQRAERMAKRPLTGAKHARSVAAELPPGAIYMTSGDGFIFSQWYQSHVLHDGTDSVTINMSGVRRGWYQRYLDTRYPAACDPLYGSYTTDPKAYQKHCGDFAKRMALPKGKAWFNMPSGTFRSGKFGRRPAMPNTLPKELMGPGPEPVVAGEDSEDLASLWTKVVRGANEQCKDAVYRKKHGEECRCWRLDKNAFAVDDWCVPSLEEGGIVPRSITELYGHGLIQDNIHIRPVFERNMYTKWAKKSKNPRKWDGPAQERPPANFTLLNRGRSNQFLLTEDILQQGMCNSTTLDRVKVPELAAPKPGARPSRTPYYPSAWPILLRESYLTLGPKDNGDQSTLKFRRGSTVHARLSWFERWKFDDAMPDKRGEVVAHGVKVCIFNAQGERIALETVRSGVKNANVVKLPLPQSAAPGKYVIQACTVGETENREEAAARPCLRPILEYEFTVTK